MVTPRNLPINQADATAAGGGRLQKGSLSSPFPPLNAASPFDGMAADYDRNFTHTLIGRLMRQAVWSRLEACFSPGDRVLELNCGTGEDAVFLARRGVQVLATDNSPAMLQVTREKIRQARLAGVVTLQEFDSEELARGSRPLFFPGACQESPGQTLLFDGAFSNFGGLNCLNRFTGGGKRFGLLPAPRSRPAALCDGAAGRLGMALVSLAAAAVQGLSPPPSWGTGWRGLRIRYPLIGQVRRAFGPHFRMRRLSAIGAFFATPYAEAWAARHPDLIGFLNRWERRLETLPPLPWLADHYLLEMARR